MSTPSEQLRVSGPDAVLGFPRKPPETTTQIPSKLSDFNWWAVACCAREDIDPTYPSLVCYIVRISYI